MCNIAIDVSLVDAHVHNCFCRTKRVTVVPRSRVACSFCIIGFPIRFKQIFMFLRLNLLQHCDTAQMLSADNCI